MSAKPRRARWSQAKSTPMPMVEEAMRKVRLAHSAVKVSYLSPGVTIEPLPPLLPMPQVPPNAQTVPDILRADIATFERKAKDYAPTGNDPYENFIFSATFASRVCCGMADDDPIRATAVLIGTKISRLMTLGLAKAAANENVLDTLGDLRCYLAIAEAQLAERGNK